METAKRKNNAPIKQKTDLDLLAEMILEKGMTREEAKIEFGKSDSQFRVVFHEVTDRIVIDALMKNPKGSQATHLTCRTRRWATGARMLMLDYNREEAVRIAKKALRIAERYDLDTAFNLLRMLRTYYTSIKPVRNSALKKISDRLDHIQKELMLEYEIERIKDDLNHCILKKETHVPFKNQLAAYSVGQSWRYNYYYYLSKIKVAQIENDENAIIEICREASTCFNQYEFPLPHQVRFSLGFHIIPIYIKNFNKIKAETAINRLLPKMNGKDEVKKGTINWHLLMYSKMVNGIWSDKPLIVKEAWQAAIKTDNKLNFAVTERLVLVKAVLHIYELQGRIVMDSKFRLGTFLNSMPHGVTNTKGINISIKIVTLLYLFLRSKKSNTQRKRIDYERKFGEEVESAQAYIYNNLRGSDSSVLRLFVEVEKGRHRLNQFDMRVKKITRKPRPTDFYDSEIIPYETVKEIIQEHLR